MRIIVHEVPESRETPVVYHVDLSKIDSTNPNHVAYKQAIENALQDPDGNASVDMDSSIMIGDKTLFSLHSNDFPQTFDGSVTLYIND